MSLQLTNDDKLFFKQMMTYTDFFEDIIDESLKYNIDFQKVTELVGDVDATDEKNKTKSYKYIIFGTYNTEKNEFSWFPQVKDMLKKNLLERYTASEVDLTTINKLTESDKFILEPKYKNVIPYMIGLVYQVFNVIRFLSGDLEIYMLINLAIPNVIYMEDIMKKFNENRGTTEKKSKQSRKKSKKSSHRH